MAMTTEVYRGQVILYENEPHVILEKEFYSPGKGAAFNRTKLKNIRTGKIFPVTFKSGEKLDELTLETRNMQYLYEDSTNAVFMDPSNFEQINISLEEISGGTKYLHADAKYVMTFYEEKPLVINLPQKITLKVISAPEGVKGDTATGATKEAVVETGAKIMVPLFIKEGDTIVINTEREEYDSKVN